MQESDSLNNRSLPHQVYILKSDSAPDEIYIGMTQNMKERMVAHNGGHVRHTSKFIPWKCLFYATFPNKTKAREFEVYLKSHSGRAFLRKRLI